MEIYVMMLVNIAIFIIGLFFGSFYTLARYRIPRKIDIVRKPSFCPQCDHKLGALEQIPVLSYLIMGGKCLHCKKKIDVKYLFTEIFTGIMFLVIYNVFNLGVVVLNLSGFGMVNMISILSILAIPFVYSFMYLTAIIDKDSKGIDKSMLAYGVALTAIITMARYIFELMNNKNNMLYAIVYYSILILITIFQMNKYRKNKEISYIADVMSVIIILIMIFGNAVMIPSVIITFIIFIMVEVITTNNIILRKLENRKKAEKDKEKEEHKLRWKTFTPITPILMAVTGAIYLLYASFRYLS